MSAADAEREKLGEALYVKVSKFQPEELAGKITGMMLNSFEAEAIQSVMDDEPSLREKVEEALQLLRKGAEQDQISFLQDELRQAEQWADGMQRDWDEKEGRWKKEKEELTKRISSLEGRASKEDAGEKIDEEQMESAKKTLSDIVDQNSKLEEELRKMQRRASDLEKLLKTGRQNIDREKEAAKVADEKLLQAETLKSDAEKDEKVINDELKDAEKWCEDMVSKSKQELAVKEEELDKAKVTLKAASDTAAEKLGSTALDDLENKLKELDVLAKSTSQHADEAESLAKKAEEELAGMRVGNKTDSKKVEHDKSKLQEELASLQSQIEKSRSKLEASKGDMKQSEKIASAERDAQKAKEERIRIEGLIADAQRQMNELHHTS